MSLVRKKDGKAWKLTWRFVHFLASNAYPGKPRAIKIHRCYCRYLQRGFENCNNKYTNKNAYNKFDGGTGELQCLPSDVVAGLVVDRDGVWWMSM
jgi:hypothetical protein